MGCVDFIESFLVVDPQKGLGHWKPRSIRDCKSQMNIPPIDLLVENNEIKSCLSLNFKIGSSRSSS